MSSSQPAGLAINPAVHKAYDEQYDQKLQRWRDLAGSYKARNIREVCGDVQFGRVLDIGAGEGAVLSHFQDWPQKKELYAVEISKSGLEMLRHRNLRELVEARQFDGYSIPYPDKYFDLTILSHVLEHVEFPRAILREMARVSRYQAIEIPCDYFPDADRKVEHFTSYGHINIYSPTMLRFLLKAEGFHIRRELLSCIALEVKQYNQFVNRGRSRTLAAMAKLRLSHIRRRLRYRLAGRKRRETMADAYTVFCEPHETLRIFNG